MESTRLVRYLKQFEDGFKRAPRLLQACSDQSTVNTIVGQLASRSKHPNATSALSTLYGRNGHPKFVGLAYLLLLKFESADGIYSIVERVQDRIHRCSSAQKQAYTLTVTQGAHLMVCRGRPLQSTLWDEELARSQILESNSSIQAHSPNIIPGMRYCVTAAERQAMMRIQEIIEDYLETHKENAFMSAFHEPARWYYDVSGNHHHRDHVDVHGLNGWLCLIRGWFGAQIPIIPESSDGDVFKGCSDVWAGMSSAAWDVFKADKNFGKSYKGLTKQLKSQMVTNKKFGSNFNSGRDTGFTGPNARHMENEAKKKKKMYRPYCEKFAYFFRLQFLVKKLFEVLNAEEKAEHIGFRQCCNVLFPIFCERELKVRQAPDFLEFFYDEMLMNLDIHKAARFFWWLGVIKKDYTTPIKADELDPQYHVHECGKCGCLPSPPGKFCDQCGDKIAANWDEEEAFFGESKEADRKPPARNSKSPKRPQAPPPKKAKRRPSPRIALEPLDKPPTPPHSEEQQAIHADCIKCGQAPVAPFKFCIGCGDNLSKQREAEAEKKPAAAKKAAHTAGTICVVEGCGCDLFPPANFCHQCGAKQPMMVKSKPRLVTPPATPLPPVVVEEEVEDPMTCPICMEVKSSTMQIPHWQAKGDISGHKMCTDCAKQYNKNECPFCHEVSIKEELLTMIQDFIRAVSSSGGDPNRAAALAERWQWFEMEFSTNVSVVHRVCKLVLEDAQFEKHLRAGVRDRSSWIRDANGLIFRWRSLSKDGKLDVSEEIKEVLEMAYKLSVSLLKGIGANGHHMGAFYSQALAVWLAAFQGQDDGPTLKRMVKHAGKIIIEMYEKGKRGNGNLKREVRERIVAEYSQIFSSTMFGGEDQDPVHKAFYC